MTDDATDEFTVSVSFAVAVTAVPAGSLLNENDAVPTDTPVTPKYATPPVVVADDEIVATVGVFDTA